jgi:hypothetical protein
VLFFLVVILTRRANFCGAVINVALFRRMVSAEKVATLIARGSVVVPKSIGLIITWVDHWRLATLLRARI